MLKGAHLAGKLTLLGGSLVVRNTAQSLFQGSFHAPLLAVTPNTTVTAHTLAALPVWCVSATGSGARDVSSSHHSVKRSPYERFDRFDGPLVARDQQRQDGGRISFVTCYELRLT